jgi:hypothetical protein
MGRREDRFQGGSTSFSGGGRLFTPAEHLHSWRQPSNQDDIDSSVTRKVGRSSFLFRYAP